MFVITLIAEFDRTSMGQRKLLTIELVIVDRISGCHHQLIARPV